VSGTYLPIRNASVEAGKGAMLIRDLISRLRHGKRCDSDAVVELIPASALRRIMLLCPKSTIREPCCFSISASGFQRGRMASEAGSTGRCRGP